MQINEIQEILTQALIRELRLEDVTPETLDVNAPLFGDSGLGLDSLDAVELVVLVEKHFGVAIASAEQAQEVFGSVTQLTNYIAEQTRGQDGTGQGS